MISIPGRIPIRIYPMFLILIILIGWLNSQTFIETGIWALVIFFSILFHEYGHALTAIAFDQTAEISFIGMGGLTSRTGPKISKVKEFLIVLNGPLVSLILGFLSYLVAAKMTSNSGLVAYALNISMYINFFWTFLNLMPVIPLDGGQLMRILLEGFFKFQGQKLALLVSLIFACILGIIAFAFHQVIIAAIFIMFGFESYRAWKELKVVTKEDQDQSLQQLFQEAQLDLQRGMLDSALEKCTAIRQQAPKGILYVNASQLGARVLVEQKNYKKAHDWLTPLQNRLILDYLQLLQHLSYRMQEWEQVIKVGTQIYQSKPAADTALLNAYSYAILGQAEPSVGWLRSAVVQGLSNVHQTIEKREFDAIRSSPIFQNWIQTLKKE